MNPWRHVLAWSGSRQSWRERGVALAVVASAGILWYFAPGLPLLSQLTLWTAWLLTVLILQQRGELPLFGPVLFYDMVRTARRAHYVLMRWLYGIFLLMLLFVIYSLVAEANLDNRAQAARLAGDFFEWLMIVQIAAVVLLTPAYFGGAIADEKERRTLEFILATDLRNQEVILSKLGARLANLTLFLLTGLPILSLLQFLGGIDPNLVLIGYAVTGLTMLGTGSISLLYSVLLRRSRDAIACTYLFMVAYFFLATLLLGVDASGGWKSALDDWFDAQSPLLPVVVEALHWLTVVINTGSPLALIIHIGRSGQAGTLAATLPGLLRDYASFHFIVTAVCLGWSILRLRQFGLRQTGGPEIKREEAGRLRPPVGDLPVLWKELLENRTRLGWPAWIAIVFLGLLSIGTGLWICGTCLMAHLADIFFGSWASIRDVMSPINGLPESMNVWARIAGGAVGSITLLWVAVRASTSISSERDRQTLDALITTQLASDAILGAKLLGSICGTRLGIVWLGCVLLLACLTGGIYPLAVPLTLGAWLIYASFFAMLGLFCSMVCSTSTKATVATVLIGIMLAVGHWLIWLCLGPLFMFLHSSGPDTLAESIMKFQVGMSPPIVLGFLIYSYPNLAEGFSPNNFGEFLAYCLLGLFVWGAAAVVFWFGSLAPRFREVMRREHGYPERPDAALAVRDR